MYKIETIIPSIIPNTIMEKYIDENGKEVAYKIIPEIGYLLHDKIKNKTKIDPNNMEETIEFGYVKNFTTCFIPYDFSEKTVLDENGNLHISYGEREFFTILM